MKAQDFLVYFVTITNGDWEKTYDLIGLHKKIPDQEIISVLSKIKSKYITILDPEYPETLKHVVRPPFVLFYYGDISLLQNYDKCLSVVGSRDCSEYGINATKEIVKDIAKDYNIVSGLALGIDAIAHVAAMDNGGKTIAVLGSGIDYCYPKTNIEIYHRIKKEGHLIVSEYPGEIIPEPASFPFRNRIIAALSKGVLVTEAYEKSGTLITLQIALTLDRDIMCVPYPYNANSICNKFIAEGAYLVENGDDVRKAMG